MKTSTKVLSAILVLGFFYYFFKGKPSEALDDSAKAQHPKAQHETKLSESSRQAAAPVFKLRPLNVPATPEDSGQNTDPSGLADPTAQGEEDGEHNADQTHVDAQSDSEMEGHLNEQIAADDRIQRVTNVLSVNCQSGSCVVKAQAKADLEQEVQMAFILFQKEHPEFGSDFRMEPSADDPSISNFVYSKNSDPDGEAPMEPISSNRAPVPRVTR